MNTDPDSQNTLCVGVINFMNVRLYVDKGCWKTSLIYCENPKILTGLLNIPFGEELLIAGNLWEIILK